MIFPRQTAMTRFFAARSGAVFPLFAVCIASLILAVGLAVDVGRVYAVRVKMQQASDAALLGAVSTVSQTPLNTEYINLFNANFPAGYMGSTLASIGAVQNDWSGSLFSAKVSYTVPMTLMAFARAPSRRITVTSQVARGYANQPQKLELALVVDNSNVMGAGGVAAARAGLRNMVSILFAGRAVLPNVAVAVVPYANYVNINTAPRLSWVQPAYRAGYTGLVENRNSDQPRNAFNDLLTQPPTSGLAAQFRTPLYAFQDRVGAGAPVVPIRFLRTNQAAVKAAINTMGNLGIRTRINVGLLWGRMIEQPSWQGVWDPTQPTLPWSLTAQLSRAMVLISGSPNNVFSGNEIAITNDDAETLKQCVALENEGIELFVVAYGGRANQNLLSSCVADQAHFFVVQNWATLNAALASIADTLLFNTIRLSQ